MLQGMFWRMCAVVSAVTGAVELGLQRMQAGAVRITRGPMGRNDAPESMPRQTEGPTRATSGFMGFTIHNSPRDTQNKKHMDKREKKSIAMCQTIRF